MTKYNKLLSSQAHKNLLTFLAHSYINGMHISIMFARWNPCANVPANRNTNRLYIEMPVAHTPNARGPGVALNRLHFRTHNVREAAPSV